MVNVLSESYFIIMYTSLWEKRERVRVRERGSWLDKILIYKRAYIKTQRSSTSEKCSQLFNTRVLTRGGANTHGVCTHRGTCLNKQVAILSTPRSSQAPLFCLRLRPALVPMFYHKSVFGARHRHDFLHIHVRLYACVCVMWCRCQSS